MREVEGNDGVPFDRCHQNLGHPMVHVAVAMQCRT